MLTQVKFGYTGIVSPYVCSYYFRVWFGLRLPPFWEIIALLVDNMFSLYFFTIYYFSYFPFWSLGLDFGSDCLGFCFLHIFYI